MEERHIVGAPREALALWALRGLGALDPALSAEEAGGALRLRVGAEEVASRPSAGGAAVSLADLFEEAWARSPALRAAGAEGALRAAYEEVFAHLDPYSRFVPAPEARAARERRVGAPGLGLTLAAGPGGAVVLEAVEPGSPAARAGLRPGERLVAVDGVRVSHPADAAALMEGPEGEPVGLLLRAPPGPAPQSGRRPRSAPTRTATLLRVAIPPPTVIAERRGPALLLRLLSFNATTGEATERALRAAFAPAQPGTASPAPPGGVVLDLRGNRGGVLGGAVAVLDAFLAEGAIARTDGRHPEARRTWRATGDDLARGAPVVVLVDGRTSSAAELVAAGLAEAGRAAVAGSATQGKGLVQILVPLPGGAEILVSWSALLAPGGRPIQDVGVIPALCLVGEPGAASRAIARLDEGDPRPLRAALDRARALRPPVSSAEAAALRAACPPAEAHGEAEVDAALALLARPAAYEAALATVPRPSPAAADPPTPP